MEIRRWAVITIAAVTCIGYAASAPNANAWEHRGHGGGYRGGQAHEMFTRHFYSHQSMRRSFQSREVFRGYGRQNWAQRTPFGRQGAWDRQGGWNRPNGMNRQFGYSRMQVQRTWNRAYRTYQSYGYGSPYGYNRNRYPNQSYGSGSSYGYGRGPYSYNQPYGYGGNPSQSDSRYPNYQMPGLFGNLAQTPPGEQARCFPPPTGCVGPPPGGYGPGFGGYIQVPGPNGTLMWVPAE